MPSTYSHASVCRENLASELVADRSPLAGGEYNDVALAFQCFVGRPWTPGMYIDTASFEKAQNCKETGSLTMSSPTGTVTASCPPNVTGVTSATASVPAIPTVTCPKVVACFAETVRQMDAEDRAREVRRHHHAERLVGEDLRDREARCIDRHHRVGRAGRPRRHPVLIRRRRRSRIADGTVRSPVARTMAVTAPRTPGIRRISLLHRRPLSCDVADW